MSSLYSQSELGLIILFLIAGCAELWRELRGRGRFSRNFALLVSVAAGCLVMSGGAHPAALTRDSHVSLPLLLGMPDASTVALDVVFRGSNLFSLVSLVVFVAGVILCPAASLVRLRMSRVFLLQALLFSLIHAQNLEQVLTLGIVLTISLILSVRHHSRSIAEDDQRFIRSRSFTRYQSSAVVCFSLSLVLRILEDAGYLLPSPVVQSVDLISLCVAAAIGIGLFPFHGWVLPFLGSPRTTVFLPMFCVQAGLLYFFRLYAPIVAVHHEKSILFLVLPVVGILYAALLFFGENRLKRIPGYLYLNHVCLMAISAVGLGGGGVATSMLDGVNTLVATLGLIGVCALLTNRFGIRGVLTPTGLGAFFPEIAVCYLICVLTLVGFPGTLGFIEEEILLGQAIGHHNFLVAAIAVALTLNGFSSFRLFARVFMGQPVLGQDTETSLRWRERFVLYGILGVIIINGLAPSFIMDSLSRIAP